MSYNYKIKQAHTEIIENIYELRKEYEDIINDLEFQLKSHTEKQRKAEQNAEKLWKLLDDIDTASDMFKPCEENGIKSFQKFYTYSLKKSAERFKVYGSDGYNLIDPKSTQPQLEEFGLLSKYIDGSNDVKECYPTGESPIFEKNIG
jgi:hypothetical protein